MSVSGDESAGRAGFAVPMASDGAKRFPTAIIIGQDAQR